MDEKTELDLRAEISQLKRQVAALTAEPSLIARAPFGVQCYDREGYTLYLNATMVELLGIPDAEFAIGNFNIYQSEEMEASGMADHSRRALDGEFVELPAVRVERGNFEDAWLINNKSTAWYHQIWFPIRDDRGSVIGSATFLWDVTERQESQAKRLAAQRHEHLGVLAGGIAHDFNNLLSGVLGMASLALQERNVDVLQDHLSVIQDAAEQAAMLTSQLLAYAGKGQFVIQDFDPGQSLRDMSRLLTLGLPSNATFETSIDSAPCVVNGDETQFRQVVFNIVRNAIESLPDDGVVNISAGWRDVTRAELCPFQETPISPGRYFELTVLDSGAGMSEETKAKMFTPFFTEKKDGHGLGLAAVLGILRNHGGAISVHSVEGEGTLVTVLFPCREFHDLGCETSEPLELPADVQTTVLVIDDERYVRDVVVATLKFAEFNVLSAASGMEGVEMFREHHSEISLVILDLTMPQMDGAEVCRELLNIDPNVVVLLTSGFSEDEMTQKFDGMHFAGFIQKPFRAKQLIGQVQALTMLGD